MLRKTSMTPNYSPVIAVIFLVVLWYLLIGKDILPHLAVQSSNELQQEKKVYYEYPCSEANLARMIGITLGGELEQEEVDDALWYEKYYKQLQALGVKSLSEDHAFNILSSKKLKEVLSEITNVTVPIEDKEHLQLYEVLQYYGEVLKAKNIPIDYKSLTILATPTDQQDLPAWQVATNIGTFNFEGLVLDPLKSKTVQVASINNEILGVMEIESENCLLDDCTIKEVTEGGASIKIGELVISYQNQALTIEDVGKTGSLIIENGRIISFSANGDEQVGALVSTSNKKIRVILSNNQSHYIQDDVCLSCSQDYDMIYEDEKNTLAAGENWTASNFDWKAGNDVIRFVPRSGQSKIKISSLKKGDEQGGYLGTIEVTQTDGGYKVINEVDLEDYVAGVLPSEMPTSYGIEALKAQAIAIRTYGEACMESGRFIDYGAHVDDTTASQVYNRVEPNDTVQEAVKQTAGLVLKSDGKLISNKFFATSCGYTANYGEVWAGANFPSDTPSYLVARQQYLGDDVVTNMQDEQTFKKFISLSADDLEAFDEASPWFRWRVDLTGEQVENLIKPALNQLAQKNSSLITYISNSGDKLKTPVEDLGALCKMKVIERGQGGNIMNLELLFENANVTVETEYLIRSLFASNQTQGLTVVRSNQTTVDQMTLLPSAFFTIEQTQNDHGILKNVTLLGGGNGHGVGLSQDGAKGMAERGYTYKEILEHYYKDCEIVQG